MILRTRIDPNPRTWLDPTAGELAADMAIQLAKERFLFANETITQSSLRAELLKDASFSSHTTNLLATLIESTPFSRRGNGWNTDVSLGSRPPEYLRLTDILRSDSPSMRLSEERQKIEIRAGESRSNAFDISLGIIAPYATRVHILDRYGANQIADRDGWLISQLMLNRSMDIWLWTQMPDQLRHRTDRDDALLDCVHFARQVHYRLLGNGGRPLEHLGVVTLENDALNGAVRLTDSQEEHFASLAAAMQATTDKDGGAL